MDQPSLSGCYIKLGRANVHRNRLEREIRPILEFVEEAVLTETTYDPDTEQVLIYQAVWKITGTRWDGGQFPLAGAPNRFSPRDKTTIKKLGSTYGAIVERHQPFEDINDLRSVGVGGDDFTVLGVQADNRKLAMLRELSNWDKHRLLLPGYVRGVDISVPARNSVRCNPIQKSLRSDIALQAGTEIGRWNANPTGKQPEVQVDFNFRLGIGILGDGEALEVLDAIGGKILRILRDFEPLFA